MGKAVQDILDLVEWRGSSNSTPTPAKGYSKEYDGLCRELADISAEFQDYLEGVRQELDCADICYCNSKFPYQL